MLLVIISILENLPMHFFLFKWYLITIVKNATNILIVGIKQNI